MPTTGTTHGTTRRPAATHLTRSRPTLAAWTAKARLRTPLAWLPLLSQVLYSLKCKKVYTRSESRGKVTN